MHWVMGHQGNPEDFTDAVRQSNFQTNIYLNLTKCIKLIQHTDVENHTT